MLIDRGYNKQTNTHTYFMKRSVNKTYVKGKNLRSITFLKALSNIWLNYEVKPKKNFLKCIQIQEYTKSRLTILLIGRGVCKT